MKKKILFILCLLLGLMFINAGLNGIFNYIPEPTDLPKATINMFMAMTSIPWLMPLLAVVQIVGGIFYIIPRFRALGAIIITPVLVGIVMAHITVAREGIPTALLLLAIHLWVIVENRARFLPLVTAGSPVREPA
jgi:uncharacterized membrane protein YphA (DoxX/SURF4 family)